MSTDVAVTEPYVDWDDDRPLFVHVCTDGEQASMLTNLQWRGDRKDNSVYPSIWCHICGVHGFWTRGRWKSA